MNSPTVSCYYAVRKGHRTGVFKSWKEVKPLVDGYSGAVYKKFESEAEARQFVEGKTAVGKTTAAPLTPMADETTDTLCVYTDGAHSSKTQRCGVGVAFDPPYAHLSIAKRLPDGCTNQQAELDAIVCALWVLKKHFPSQVEANVWTDSDYSCKCLLQYIHGWRRNGWMTSKEEPVKHRKLIEDADRLLRGLPNVKLRHISEVGLSSHATRESVLKASPITKKVWWGNKQADELARGL